MRAPSPAHASRAWSAISSSISRRSTRDGHGDDRRDDARGSVCAVYRRRRAHPCRGHRGRARSPFDAALRHVLQGERGCKRSGVSSFMTPMGSRSSETRSWSATNDSAQAPAFRRLAAVSRSKSVPKGALGASSISDRAVSDVLDRNDLWPRRRRPASQEVRRAQPGARRNIDEFTTLERSHEHGLHRPLRRRPGP